MKKNTSVIYLHDREYNNASERGVRYNDPLINLKFPINLTNISKKDKITQILVKIRIFYEV